MRGKNRKITLAQVYDINNVRAADLEARKGKAQNYGVRKFDRNKESNLIAISEAIKNGTFKTMQPVFEERYCDKKVRVLSKVHYPYHVAHHALMRVIMPVLEKGYYYESAASIKGRGIHYSTKHVRKWIDLHNGEPLWWAQVDFTKFYHHINRQKLYDRLCKTFNDEGIRWMLHDIIWALGNHNGIEPSDETEGVGIGLYPIQPLVNFYTGDMVRDVNSIKGIRLFVYCDNNLILGTSPDSVWEAVNRIRFWADNMLRQPIHDNIGVQRLDEVHPVDYCGYLFFREHTLIRKSTKYKFKKRYKKTINDEVKHRQVLASYKGWLEHCNGLTLWHKVTGMKRFSELGIQRGTMLRDGKKFFDVPSVSASFLVDRDIIVKDFAENCDTGNGKGRMYVLVEANGKEMKFCTNNPRLKDTLKQVQELGELPFKATFHVRNTQGGRPDYYFE